MKKYVTFTELHEFGYGFSRQHLRRLIAAGRFPEPIRLGLGERGRVQWDESEILVYRARAEAEAQRNAAERKVLPMPTGKRKAARSRGLMSAAKQRDDGEEH
jgi:predicted DNA-binding transcriptional regulator AlpA